MVEQTKTIAETKNFIVLDKYTKEWDAADRYQSEDDLERELVQDLVSLGYEFLSALTTPVNFVPVPGHWGTLPLSVKGAPNGTTATEVHRRL